MTQVSTTGDRLDWRLAGVAWIVACLASSPATAEPVLGYWRFEEDAFTADSSGNGHSLTMNGTVRQVAIGSSGNRTQYFPTTIPQTGATNTRAASMVNAAGSTQQGFFTTNVTGATFVPSTFTIEAFASRSASVSGNTGVSIASLWQGTDNLRSWGLQIAAGNGRVQNDPNNTYLSHELVFVYTTDGTTATREIVPSGYQVALDQEYYVAASYLQPTAQDVNDGWITFWFQDLNGGSLQSTAFQTSDVIFSSGSTLSFQIGTLNNDNLLRWMGALDEVRLSGAVLSQSQLLISVPEPALGMAAASCALAAAFVQWRRRRKGATDLAT